MGLASRTFVEQYFNYRDVAKDFLNTWEEDKNVINK
jgi:hypothetical protein